MKKTLLITISFFTLIALTLPLSIKAQEDTTPPKEVKYKAKILEITIEECPDNYGEGECYFFELEILDGEKKGEKVESIANQNDDPKLSYLNYKKGLKVYIVETEVAGETQYYIKEPLRKTSIMTLTIIFILIVIIIGGLQGVSSLLAILVAGPSPLER